MTSVEDSGPPRPRRRRGEPRRLLVLAAREVFNAKGFAGASTREISDRAGVSETLMFRHFKTKAGLFREAMVAPFVEFVDRFVQSREGVTPTDDPEELSKRFVGELYDLCRAHRALAAMLLAGDVHTQSELAASGVLDEVRDQLERLVGLGESEMRFRGSALPRQDLATRTTIALVAGMATFGTWFFGTARPSRDAVVQELSDAVLYGHDRSRRPGG
jgi:AcrR family transcriptional regulator